MRWHKFLLRDREIKTLMILSKNHGCYYFILTKNAVV
jgi:hypothetical protein